MIHDIYKFKTKNLHQELTKLVRDYSRYPIDERDFYILVDKLLKKHNYCTGGCPWADAYNNIDKKENEKRRTRSKNRNRVK